MLMPRSSRCLSVLVGITLLLKASAVWSAESRQIRAGHGPARAIVSGLLGEALVFPGDASKGAAFLRFHDVLEFGDEFETSPGSVTEVLVGRQVLVTVYEESRVRFLDDTPDHTIVHVMKGNVRIAAVRSDQAVVIRVPGATAVTYGALVRVNVKPGTRAATANLRHDGAYPARPAAMMAEGRVASFQVVEGLIQLQSSSPKNSFFTLKAGQSVRILEGQMEGPSLIASQPAPARLPATDAHALIASRAVQHVVAREQVQAEALQHVLLEGATETAEPHADFRNVILSTSLGVQLVNPPAGQGGQQGSFNVPAPAAIGATTPVPSIPQPVQPLPGSATVAISPTPPPTFPASSAVGGSASPFTPPPAQSSGTGVGPINGPSISPPIPRPAQLPPSLPALLGTLDILQIDRGKAFKDKPDKHDRGDRPFHGRR